MHKVGCPEDDNCPRSTPISSPWSAGCVSAGGPGWNRFILGFGAAALVASGAPPARAQRRPPEPLLLFAEQAQGLGAHQPCADTEEGCYSNYVVSFDLDGDGDLDFVFASGGGYYEPGQAELMAVYVNNGRARFSEVSQTATGGFTGRLRQIAVGDIDGDGDLDMVAPDAYGLQPDAVFVNDGRGVFANEGERRLGTSSRAGATRLGDLDGDGDLDLIITDWGDAPPTSPGTAKVYLNDGVGLFHELVGAVPATPKKQGTGPIDADLLDFDGDFDLDLLLASREGESLLFSNRGDGTFEDAGGHLPDQPGPYVYGPDACDVDGDGDLDLWLDNGGPDVTEQLLLNDAGTFVDATATSIQGNLVGGDDNQVRCVDYNDDGDFDVLIASLSDYERLLRNDGMGRFQAVPEGFPRLMDATLAIDLGDFDGDGRLDAVSAQGEFGDYRNRLYLGTKAQAIDEKAPVLRAIERPERLRNGQLWVRFAVFDRVTTDVGPRLRRAWLESASGDSVTAEFIGGDLFLAIVANVADGFRYRVCAEDPSGNATCSDERSFSASAAGPPPDPPHAEPEPSAGADPGVAPSIPPAMVSPAAAVPESAPPAAVAALPAPTSDSGSGCAVTRPSSSPGQWLPLAALFSAFFANRLRAARGLSRD